MSVRGNSVVLLAVSTVGLGACAYSVNRSHQDIQFITPGAEYAQCDVYVDKLRYQVNPPQKINIMKSDDPMEIRCIAPGNRMKTAKVSPDFETKTLAGTPVGMAWDYAADAMFAYPSVIAIDFSQEETKPFPPPRHNAPDVVQPEDYDLEEYLPGQPRLNRDRHMKSEPIRRRDDVNRAFEEIVETPIDALKQTAPDKGNLVPAPKKIAPAPQPSSVTPLPLDAPALEDEMGQSNATQPVAAGGKPPVKLYPGE